MPLRGSDIVIPMLIPIWAETSRSRRTYRELFKIDLYHDISISALSDQISKPARDENPKMLI